MIGRIATVLIATVVNKLAFQRYYATSPEKSSTVRNHAVLHMKLDLALTFSDKYRTIIFVILQKVTRSKRLNVLHNIVSHDQCCNISMRGKL